MDGCVYYAIYIRYSMAFSIYPMAFSVFVFFDQFEAVVFHEDEESIRKSQVVYFHVPCGVRFEFGS